MQISERGFFAKKNLSITTIPTINNIKFEGVRVVWGYQSSEFPTDQRDLPHPHPLWG